MDAKNAKLIKIAQNGFYWLQLDMKWTSQALGKDPDIHNMYVFRRLALIWKNSPAPAWTISMADDPNQSNPIMPAVK